MGKDESNGNSKESCVLSYEQLRFEDHEGRVRIYFQKHFFFDVEKTQFDFLKLQKIEAHSLKFNVSEKRARNKFQLILNEGFQHLTNSMTGRKTVYIHRNSGIPLIGSNEFGVIDRGSNIIELKPITGCNLRCVYCSVNEGRSEETMGWADYYVEEEYLVEETAKIAALKKNPVEINIGPQGEPLLYPDMLQLIKDLKKIPNVKVISINTNGVLLNPKFIDQLAEAGLTRINISINALNQELAEKIADNPYSLQHILNVIAYAKTKMAVLLAPVIVPGLNESEMPALIELSKKISSPFPTIGFQNFLNYNHGRNPAKEMPMEKFFEQLRELEKKHDAKLLMKTDENPFDIHAESTLPKPFLKDDVVQAEIKCQGRHPGEKLAVARERVITIVSCDKPLNSTVNVKIIRDKHNIFKGILVKGKEKIKNRFIRRPKQKQREDSFPEAAPDRMEMMAFKTFKTTTSGMKTSMMRNCI